MVHALTATPVENSTIPRVSTGSTKTTATIGMGQRCAFPHRYEVKAKCPKGTTADADGKMILPSKASAKPSTAAVLQVRLADAPWNGRDDDE